MIFLIVEGIAGDVSKISKKSSNRRKAKQSTKHQDRLEKYLKLMEAEDLQELEISDGPFLVKLIREPRVSSQGRPQPSAHPVMSLEPVVLPGEESEGIAVKAPLGGILYRSPSPQSPPYVKEGDVISTGQTICIIEAMKVMNEIKATSSGRITKILVENGKTIDANQTLFILSPSK